MIRESELKVSSDVTVKFSESVYQEHFAEQNFERVNQAIDMKIQSYYFLGQYAKPTYLFITSELVPLQQSFMKLFNDSPKIPPKLSGEGVLPLP